MSGQIQVIFGPMFSGKTTELLRRIRRYTVAQRSCLVLKYLGDTRYDAIKIVTHDQQKWTATAIERLSEMETEASQYEVIGIDEAQFFPDISTFAEKMANQGKVVIVACLDGTFERKPFGDVLNLIPLAEEVTKLTAVCTECGEIAAFTKRLTDAKEIKLIGKDDIYTSLCRKCFNKLATPVQSQC
jgi:thymidine kinase